MSNLKQLNFVHKKGRTSYRPAIMGDKYTRKFKVESYSNATGKLVSTSYLTKGYTENTYNVIKYQ